MAGASTASITRPQFLHFQRAFLGFLPAGPGWAGLGSGHGK